MTNRVTRGSGLLEGFLAACRARIAEKNLPQTLRSGRILDIGCGSQPYFLSKIEFAEKYGIDPSVDQSLSGVKLFKQGYCGGEKMPFADDFLDAITMLAVAEHLDRADLEKLFQEMFRILKPGGRLFLTTPSPWTEKLLKFMAQVGLVSREEIAEHKELLSNEDLEAIAIKANFKPEFIQAGVFELGLNQWLFIDKK